MTNKFICRVHVGSRPLCPYPYCIALASQSVKLRSEGKCVTIVLDDRHLDRYLVGSDSLSAKVET